MDRGENEPLAICTTSTVTVTTKPVRAATAPTIAERTVLAVDGEYAQSAGTATWASTEIMTAAPRIPRAAPRAGTTHRLSRRYSRIRNRVAQVTSAAHDPKIVAKSSFMLTTVQPPVPAACKALSAPLV
jgi:hypothetical protein